MTQPINIASLHRVPLAVLLLHLAAVVTAAAAPPLPHRDTPTKPTSEEGPTVRLERDVQPILRAKCIGCHGKWAQKAELNLATVEGILRGGESGPVIDKREPDQSLLLEMIDQGSMPPDDQPPLTDQERRVIGSWILQGAPIAAPPRSARSLTDHDVLPVLQLRCTVCHGRQRRENQLDLRSAESILRGGKSGPAIVPGKPEQSLLIRKIEAGEMPPRREVVAVSVKPMAAGELDILKQWIAEGARSRTLGPDVATTTPDPLVTDADRSFWSFRPPRAGRIPGVAHERQVHHPIDAFVLRQLEQHGLQLSPPADRATLLRRVWFDLLGLPPPVEEIERFVSDPDPLAYEKQIERLLASPRYGERWGAHWLDVAGYADSEGVQHSDPIRPHAYRYRDYVIRAFNADKPYDQFLVEQIAGDELADYESAATITAEMYDNLVATAFLHLTTNGTHSNITNFVPDRLKVIHDEMEILGSAVLGLTIKCARCHSHKFDPIPQRDYYRLLAVFKAALDEHDWLRPTRQNDSPPGHRDRLLPYVSTSERLAWQQHEDQLRQQIEALKAKADKASDEQIKALEAKAKPQPLIRAVWDRGAPSPTFILKRGNYLTPGRMVGPGVPSVLTDGKTPFVVQPPWPGSSKTGRRLAFVRWLVKHDHPLTARVLVNRLWKHHFGRGIVATLDNFGHSGAAPTHPELLDWLAVEFTRKGWSIKAMQRLMLTSDTYRQSSQVRLEHQQVDPDNRLFSRMPLRRMEAEVLRDSLLSISGQLDLTAFGPPDGVEARGDGLVLSQQASSGGWRRSVYVLKRRTQMLTILDNFDRPRMNPNCVERTVSTVAPQALHLMNNRMVYELAGHFAERVLQRAGANPAGQIDQAYRIAVGRSPSPQEQAIALASREELARRWSQQLDGSPPDSEQVSRRALQNLCHGLMNSAAFLYID